MKTYTLTLAAGVALGPLPLGGRSFLLLDAPYPVTVDFSGDQKVSGGEQIADMLAGDWADPVSGFAALTFTSATAQTIKIMVTNGRAGRFRVAGDVSIIDGGKARTLAATAFMGTYFQGPVPGEYAHVQLHMASSTNNRAVIKSVTISIGAAGGVRIARSTTQLSSFLAVNAKLASSTAVASARMYIQSNAVQQYTATWGDVDLLALTPYRHVFDEPIVIGGGRGLTLINQAVNNSMRATFEFFEEPNV